MFNPLEQRLTVSEVLVLSDPMHGLFERERVVGPHLAAVGLEVKHLAAVDRDRGEGDLADRQRREGRQDGIKTVFLF